jgi:hypothetical protein
VALARTGRLSCSYANGLDKFGYENNPIEKMAYDAEASFKRSSAIFDAEKFVAEKLRRLWIFFFASTVRPAGGTFSLGISFYAARIRRRVNWQTNVR